MAPPTRGPGRGAAKAPPEPADLEDPPLAWPVKAAASTGPTPSTPTPTTTAAPARASSSLRASAVRVVESRPWRIGVVALVIADLVVVMAEVALTNAHPELEACAKRPRPAELAAQGLHITTLALLAALNAEWLARAAVLGPLHFFAKWQHWVDAWLVGVALGLEVALHGASAVTANLGLIVLRLARVGHALIELSLAEAAHGARATRVRAVGLTWRLAARAAVAEARLDCRRGVDGWVVGGGRKNR